MENELLLVIGALFIPSIVVCSLSWIGTIIYVRKQNRKVLESIKNLLEKLDG